MQPNNVNNGIFIISLDFEMYWGVRDKCQVKDYEENLKGVHQAIPQMLDLFNQHNIHATWATVGFLFYDSAKSLIEALPKVLPTYENANFSPYLYLEKEHSSMQNDYHFCPDLIRQILEISNQEVATHTFSHYYCLETGQTRDAFEADLDAAIIAAQSFGIDLRSIVFPRNQYNKDYLGVLSEKNIKTYRGNENHWLYQAGRHQKLQYVKRFLRLLDSYLNISGHHCYSYNDSRQQKPFNLPSSRFLRPYNIKLRHLEEIRLRRIKKSMHYAAKKNQIYHLWWHPHNFGKYTKENMAFLKEIILYFKTLQTMFHMKSLNMSEVGSLVRHEMSAT